MVQRSTAFDATGFAGHKGLDFVHDGGEIV